MGGRKSPKEAAERLHGLLEAAQGSRRKEEEGGKEGKKREKRGGRKKH